MSAEMKTLPSVSVPLRLNATVSTCSSSVNAPIRLQVTAVSRSRRLILRAISWRETMNGSGEAARNTPRKISDAVSIEIPSAMYQYPAAPAARRTLAIKCENVEKLFFKDVQLLPYRCYRGIIA